MPYWYNVRTGKVEAHEDPGRAQGGDLMGPYDTETQAADGLETAVLAGGCFWGMDRADREWETGDPDANYSDNNPLNG